MDRTFDVKKLEEKYGHLGLTVRKCEPGGVGGIFIKESDGSKREITMEDIFPGWEDVK
ncbi:hypothetical protein [Bacillus pumilus]|uniref:hypothetical protein n=1 Tax=Bacillus pumilus TaxID=1408 RepID=UPI0015D56EBA|nr:hypothetical protein [Bacillus pumilus]QLI77096.1 hypothetical protein HZ310_04435 [Bacillus pumilus]